MSMTTSYNVQVAYMYLLSLGYYNNTTVLLYIYYNLPPGSIDSSTRYYVTSRSILVFNLDGLV